MAGPTSSPWRRCSIGCSVVAGRRSPARRAGGCRYEPLGERQADLPVGWDGVLARALAPRPEGRFEALSEFWLALQKPLAHPQRVFAPRRLQRGVLALVLLLAGAALLVGLAG